MLFAQQVSQHLHSTQGGRRPKPNELWGPLAKPLRKLCKEARQPTLEGSPAARHGGVQTGDVLLSVGETKVLNQPFETVRGLLLDTAQQLQVSMVFGRPIA